MKTVSLLLISVLPKFLKLPLYRLLGWTISSSASISFGAIFLGKLNSVEIGDHVKIKSFSIIRAETIKLDAYSTIGAFTVIAVPMFTLGKHSSIGNLVWISTGMDRPTSSFKMGDHSTLMERSYVNAADSIKIGSNVGIGGCALIFTHGYWSNTLKGYPRSIAPVIIEDDVWLPWRVFVMPGTVIKTGSVIGANTTIYGTIQPNSLVTAAGTRVWNDKYKNTLYDPDKIKSVVLSEINLMFSHNGYITDNDGEILKKGNIIWNVVFDFNQIRPGIKTIFFDLNVDNKYYNETVDSDEYRVELYFNLHNMQAVKSNSQEFELLISVLSSLGLRFYYI
jgi:acetyltransferase-like isoleucine patch superfamily enzyme